MFYTFFIQDAYETTTIEEPRGWKDLFNVLERDFETHGVFFKYTDKGLKLGFKGEAKDLLEDAYQDTGTESFYQFGVIESVSQYVEGTQIFLGDIDFETRLFESDYFNAEINVIDVLSKLKTRRKLETNLNRGQTHDGTAVGNINYEKVALLATKRYEQLIGINNGSSISETSVVDTDESQMYAQIGFDQTESVEIEKYSKVVTKFTPVQGDIFLTFSEDTAIKWGVEYDLDLAITETQGSGTTEYIIRFLIIPDRLPADGELPLYIIENESSSGASPHNYSTTYYGYKESGFAGPFAGDFAAETQWYFGISIEMTSTGNSQFSAELDIRYIKLTGTDASAKVGTVSRTYHPHDALNKTLNFITDEYDFLYSTLLGDQIRGYNDDGCLSTMRLTNGFRIRQILDTDKAPEFSFSEFVKNIDAPGAIGYGLEELESPTFLIKTSQSESTWVFMPYNTQLNIVGVDLTSEISIGDTLYFYNSDGIWGAFEVDGVSFAAGVTVVGVVEREDVDSILKETIFNDVVIYTNAVTEDRERLRLEKWEHFYGDSELYYLGDVEEYIEEPFDDILYNKFDLGFKKYANDENKPTTLEDFETKSSWGLPLTKSDKILSRVMSWVMSTFMINESRDTIFDQKPTTSHKLDDDIFLFDVDNLEVNAICQFVHNASSDDEVIVPDYVYENYIREEGVFNVVAITTPGNSGNYQFYPDRVLHNVADDTYTIPVWQVVTNATELVAIKGYISQDDDGEYEGSTYYSGSKAEADENLTSSANISGPEYTYNQRRTQKRFLIRWGRFINSVLGYISDVTQTIQNLFYVNNGDFTTQLGTFAITEECLFGAPDEEIREADDITTDSFPAAKFKPNIIKCTVKICDADYDYIVNAHKNVMPYGQEDQAYGYFRLNTPRNERKTGWLLNIKRSPVDRIAKLQLIERYVGTIIDDCKYIFSGAEKITIPVPAFEYTSSFIFIAYVKNGTYQSGGPLSNTIWSTQTGLPDLKGLRILIYLDGATTIEKKIQIFLNNQVGATQISVISTDELITADQEYKIKITYNGSGLASGLALEVDDVSKALTTSIDTLSGSIDTGEGATVGINKVPSGSLGEGGFTLSSMLWNMDGTDQFETNCPNNGDDVATDTSGQGNDGKIDRDTTSSNAFYDCSVDNAYNFTGIEKITIPIVTFERTQTFYYKGKATNGIGANNFVLWTNRTTTGSSKGIEILIYNSTDTHANKLAVGFTSSLGNWLLVRTTNAIFTPASGSHEIEITYDGSSLASGFDIVVDGSPVAYDTIFDALTASIQNNSSATIGRTVSGSPEGKGILEYSEFTIDGTKLFGGLCTNLSNDIYDDTDSGLGNDGVIDRSTSTADEFYISV